MLNKHKKITLTFVIILLFLSLFSGNCTQPEFKKYVLGEDDIRYKISDIVSKHPRFSLEYPSSFGLLDLNKLFDIVNYGENITEVQFTRKTLFSSKEQYIFIDVFEKDPVNYRNLPTSILDWVLNKSSGKSIVEESAITIASIPAEYYKCFVSGPNSNSLYFIAYFEYSGFKWEICMVTYKNKSELAQDEFKHIIDTFTFLD
jgi:hypothetical protein